MCLILQILYSAFYSWIYLYAENIKALIVLWIRCGRNSPENVCLLVVAHLICAKPKKLRMKSVRSYLVHMWVYLKVVMMVIMWKKCNTQKYSLWTSIHRKDIRSGIMPFCKITRNPNNVPYGYVRKGSPQKKDLTMNTWPVQVYVLAMIMWKLSTSMYRKMVLWKNTSTQISYSFHLLCTSFDPITALWPCISPNLLSCSNPLSRVLVLTSSLSGPQWALTYVCAILCRPHPNITYSVSRAPVPSARIALVPLPLYIFTLFGDLIFMYRQQQQCSTLHSWLNASTGWLTFNKNRKNKAEKNHLEAYVTSHIFVLLKWYAFLVLYYHSYFFLFSSFDVQKLNPVKAANILSSHLTLQPFRNKTQTSHAVTIKK